MFWSAWVPYLGHTMHDGVCWANVGHRQGFVASLPLVCYTDVSVSTFHLSVFPIRST